VRAAETSEAKTLYVQVVRGYTRALGADHPCTLRAKLNRANLLHGCGDTDKARPLYEEVVQARESALGCDHEDTMAAKINLAAAHLDEGKLVRPAALWIVRRSRRGRCCHGGGGGAMSSCRAGRGRSAAVARGSAALEAAPLVAQPRA
jgi:hypothetical protein